MAKPKKTKPKSAFGMTPEELRRLDHETLVGLISRLLEQNQQLSELLQIMVREKHAPKTERFENPDQLNIFEAKPATEPASPVSQSTKHSQALEPCTPTQKTPSGHSRNPMPSTLERERVTGEELSGDDLTCKHCSSLLVKFNEVIRNSRYECKPASVFVQDFVAMIFRCDGCGDTVTVEPNVTQPIENGTAGPALLAEIVTAKFEDHMPLHRQEQRFFRIGVNIARSTMVGWIAATAIKLKPIYDRMHELLLLAKIIATDDTPVKVQDRKKKKNIKAGRVWIHRGGKDQPFNLFDYTDGRGRVGPLAFLRGFRNFLQGDCFSGNLALCAETGATFVACGAHARRYFIKAHPNNKESCDQILQMFADLFEIDRCARDLGLSEQEVSLMRRQEALPILTSMKAWLDKHSLTALPQSSFGKAVNYCLNNWSELNNYLLDGDLRFDNNLAEHEMKRVAIGKKNWYFLGSDNAGKHAAVLLSITSTCKRHGINPAEYIKDVLEALTVDPGVQIDSLLPNNWQKKEQKSDFKACHITPKLALR